MQKTKTYFHARSNFWFIRTIFRLAGKFTPVVISLIHLTIMIMTTIIIMTINHGEHDHEHLELTLNFDVGLGLYDSKLGSGDASVGVRLPDVGQQ